ncbi:MAG: hypothetical protein ACP6IP_02145 [Candidatus Njordarchaeia archaeon]
MPLAIIVTTSGGVPILIREISPLFSFGKEDQRSMLVSSIITAMVDFAKEALHEDVKRLVIGDYYLHITKSEDFLVCIIDTYEQRRYFELGRKIIELVSSKGYDQTVVISDQETEELWREIKKLIESMPNPIEFITDVYTRIKGFLTKRECSDTIGLEINKRDSIRPHLIPLLEAFKFTKLKAVESSKFEELLNKYFDWNFEEVYKGANSKFIGIPEDYVKVLLANTILNLRAMDPIKEAPSLDHVEQLLDTVEDDTLKNLNKIKIRFNKEVDAFHLFLKYFSEHKGTILDKIKKMDIEGKIYLISLLEPSSTLLDLIKPILDEIKKISKAYYYTFLALLDREEIETDFDKFVEKLSKLNLALENAEDNVKMYLLVLNAKLVYLRNMFRSFPMDYDDLKKLLSNTFNEAKKVLDKLLRINLPLKIKLDFIENLHDLLCVIGRYIGIPGCKELREKLFDISSKLLSKTIRYYYTQRISISTFYSGLIKLSSVIVQYMFNEGKCPIDLFNAFKEFMSKEVEKFYKIELVNYRGYYINTLFILLHFATRIKIGFVRKNIISRICGELDALSKNLDDTDPYKFTSTVYAVAGYFISDDPALQIEGERLIREVEKNFPEHLYRIVVDIKRYYTESL